MGDDEGGDRRRVDVAVGVIRSGAVFEAVRVGVCGSKFLRRFLLWAVSPQPSLDPQITLDEWKELALVAEEYEVIALRNQLADWFNQRIVFGDWVLQPEMLSEVYRGCDPQSPLRKVCRAALMSVPRGRHEGEGDRWNELVREGGDLAIDVYKAGLLAQTGDVFGGFGFGVAKVGNIDACCFHQHPPYSTLNGTEDAVSVGEDGMLKCPYRMVEFFPDEVTTQEAEFGPPPAEEVEPGPESEPAFVRDASRAVPIEEDALVTEEVSVVCDQAGEEAAVPCDEAVVPEDECTVHPTPVSKDCVNDWAVPSRPKKNKKGKKPKKKSLFDEVYEVVPAEETTNGWETLDCN